jgi:hypothetical protein
MQPAVRQQGNDCAVVALATYLGFTYEAVLVALVRAADVPGNEGLTHRQILATATRLGAPLRYRKRIRLDTDFCILDFPEHVAMLRRGLLWEPDGVVWDVHDYLRHTGLAPVGGFFK